MDVRALSAQLPLGKNAAQSSLATLDLANRMIGAKVASEAIAAMLMWNLTTITKLELRCTDGVVNSERD